MKIGPVIWNASHSTEPGHWDFQNFDVCRQSNMFDCGIMTIVFAIYHATDCDIPRIYDDSDSTMWRLLLYTTYCNNNVACSQMFVE